MHRCHVCGEEQTKKYIFISSNKKSEFHLCSDCYLEFLKTKQLEGYIEEPVETGLDRLMEIFIETCPVCGKNAVEYAEDVQLGCESCHDTFSRNFSKTLKMPFIKDGEGILKVSNMKELLELSDNINITAIILNAMLQKAIKTEDYETAARIRDDMDFLRSIE